jgi:hypothetical protein
VADWNAGPARTVALVYGLLLLAYWEFLNHVDLGEGAVNVHTWIFWTLLFLGALAAAAYAAAQMRS